MCDSLLSFATLGSVLKIVEGSKLPHMGQPYWASVARALGAFLSGEEVATYQW